MTNEDNSAVQVAIVYETGDSVTDPQLDPSNDG